MQEKKSFKGIWTAIVTPFEENGSIAWRDFEKILQKQVSSGITGIIIAGTTGESPALTVQEKLSLIKRARAFLGREVQIMAGSGSNNTVQSVELSRAALEAGADSLIVVTPPYNKPNLSGLVAHYSKIYEATHADICLYHVPGRTAQKLSLEDFLQLTKIPGIRSIKEASGDLGLFSAVANHCAVEVLSGDDPTFLSSLAVGGVGAISVVTNVFPRAFVLLQKAYEEVKPKAALKIHQILQPFIEILFCETNPCPLKAAMSVQGLCSNELRLPLAPVSQSNFKKIQETFQQTRAALLKDDIDA